ncbi:hypothetical protein ACWERY_37745 [Streptomyces sp. NPDC004082]
MTRGTTVRALLSALAAVLLVLQLLASAEAFASVHTSEVVSCGETEEPQKAAPPAAARDRGRAEDRTPGVTPRTAPDRRTFPCPPPVRTGPHAHAPRSSAAHSPATLQVFRC